jgi:gamma-glutamyltranspeptidase/glutathione hydrolase
MVVVCSATAFAAVHALVIGCRTEENEPELEAPFPVDGAVSSDTPEATIAGLDVLARGGNAVDAAVAVSLVLGVTEPSESGLGGSVLMLIVPEGGAGVVVEEGEAAGLRGGAGVPTALRVLHHAWTRYGSGELTWPEVVEPAIRAAADGYALGRFTHRTIVREYDRIIADRAATLQLLAPDRSIPAEASVLTNPQLAAVLERVARDGPDAFYAGEIGQRLVEALAQRGVPVDLAQLASTPPARERPALRGGFRGLVVWGAPAPHGGPDLADALGFLELAPRSWLTPSGWARTAWLAEALAFAWGGAGEHPVEHLATLDSIPLPAGGGRGSGRVLAPLDGVPTAAPASGGGGPAGAEPRGGPGTPAPSTVPPADTPAVRRSPRPLERAPGATTHFSVVDGSGMAVSATQTLGGSFGSGPVNGLGFFYRQDSHARGEAPLAPTVLSREGRAELVLGSPGGERGIAAVLQVILRVIDLEEPLEDAVSAPRLHLAPEGEGRGRLFLEGVAWQDTLSVQQKGYALWGDSLQARARARGMEVGEQGTGPVVEGLHPWFGAVNAIRWSGAAREAAGDERRAAVGGVLEKGAPTLQWTDASALRRPRAPED